MRPLVSRPLRAARRPILGRSWLAAAVALASVAAVAAAGCDEKKSTGPTANASSSAAAAASSAPLPQPSAPPAAASADPKVHKELMDRVVAYLTALQKAYGGSKPDELKAFVAFFPKTDAAQKEGKSIYETAAFAGKEGMSISSFDVTDLDLDDKLTHATAAVAEKQMQRGKPRCAIYQLSWEQQGGSWVRVGRKDIADDDCTK